MERTGHIVKDFDAALKEAMTEVTNEYFFEFFIRRNTVDKAGLVNESVILVSRSQEITKEQVGQITEYMLKAGIK